MSADDRELTGDEAQRALREAMRQTRATVPVATGAGTDLKQHPIWKLTARIDEALREIMDRTDSVHVTGIAAASTWLTAEIRGYLAVPVPLPDAAPSPLVAFEARCRALAEAQRALIASGECLNPIGMAGMADANEARADELADLIASSASPAAKEPTNG